MLIEPAKAIGTTLGANDSRYPVGPKLILSDLVATITRCFSADVRTVGYWKAVKPLTKFASLYLLASETTRSFAAHSSGTMPRLSLQFYEITRHS